MITIVQYGDSGTGKTTRSLLSSRWGPTCLFDFDGHGPTAKSNAVELKLITPEQAEQIKIVNLANLSSKQVLDTVYDTIVDELKKPSPSFSTFIYDTYTSFEDHMINYYLPQYDVGSRHFGSARQTLKAGSSVDITVMGTNDYAVLKAGVFKFLKSVKRLGINVILNAHLREPTETKMDVKEQGTLKAAGELRKIIPTEFTAVNRLYIDGYGKRAAQGAATTRFMAKPGTTLSNLRKFDYKSWGLEMFDLQAYKLEDGPPQDEPKNAA